MRPCTGKLKPYECKLNLRYLATENHKSNFQHILTFLRSVPFLDLEDDLGGDSFFLGLLFSPLEPKITHCIKIIISIMAA